MLMDVLSHPCLLSFYFEIQRIKETYTWVSLSFMKSNPFWSECRRSAGGHLRGSACLSQVSHPLSVIPRRCACICVCRFIVYLYLWLHL